jgi:hypothetical protein
LRIKYKKLSIKVTTKKTFPSTDADNSVPLPYNTQKFSILKSFHQKIKADDPQGRQTASKIKSYVKD